MTLSLRYLAAAIIFLFALPTIAAAQEKHEPAAPANKVRVLLLTDASKLLTVHYMTKGRAIRNALMTSPLTGGVGSIIVDAAETKHETSKESKILQKTVGEFNRRPIVEAGIAAVFKERTQYFDVVIPPDPSAYMTGTNVNFSKAQADGYPYVLSVKEKFAGEATIFTALNTLSAGSALEFKLFDTAAGKDMGKTGRASAFALRKQDFDPATSDRNAFVTDYGVAVGFESVQLYGALNKQRLHEMADAHGLGSEVPDEGAIFASYAKRFDYDFKLPHGWHHIKIRGESKYSANLQRLFHEGRYFRVVANVDLMLPELGQKPGDLDEYIRLFFEHLQEDGYPVDTATPFRGLALDSAYTVYSIDRPQGAGKEILAFRRLDAPFVVVYHVIFDQDFDSILAKFNSDLQTIINDSRIKIRE
jgi:hypothetical protein